MARELKDVIDGLPRTEIMRFGGRDYKYVPGQGFVRTPVDPLECSSASYGDFDPIMDWDEILPTDFYFPELMGGSDYSGSSLERSNHRCFLREFGNIPGVLDCYGGYGTFAVAVQLSVLMENDEVWDCLRALDNYPVVSDDDMSQYEMEQANEEWYSWACSDFRRALERKFNPDDEENFTERLDALTDDYLRTVFERVADSIGEYWEAESGGGGTMWIRVGKIAKSVDVDDLFPAEVPA